MNINLDVEKSMVTLIITDDGRGFDTDAPVHDRFGLIGIRERVQLLNGTFSISSKPGKGTRLDIKIPLDGGKK